MPSEHAVIAARNILYIRQHGVIEFHQSLAHFEGWCDSPQFRPHYHWLMDFSELTDIDPDPVPMMAFQARIAIRLPVMRHPPFFVLHAPLSCGAGRVAAMNIHKAWNGLDVRLPRLSETEEEALDILGQPERSFAALFAACAVDISV